MVPVTVHHSDSTIKAAMANLKDDKRMFVPSVRTVDTAISGNDGSH